MQRTESDPDTAEGLPNTETEHSSSSERGGTEQSSPSESGETEQSSPSESGETESPDDQVSLSQQWGAERDIPLWNDEARTAADGEHLYVTTSSNIVDQYGHVVAFNVEDGSVAWEYAKPADLVFDISLLDDELFMLNSDGSLTVLDATTGTQNWDFANPYTSKGDNPLWPGSITVGSDTVVVSVYDIDSEKDLTYLYAIDIESQSVDWEIRPDELLDLTEHSTTSPGSLSSIDNGTVFAGFSNMTLSVDVNSGAVNWTQNDRADGSITLTENSIVASGGLLFSLRRTDGTSKWSLYKNVAQGPNFVSKPIISDGAVYASARDTAVYALDLQEGTVDWTAETGGPIRAPPVVTDSTVWAGSRDGRVYGFDRSTGSRLVTEFVTNPVVGFESVDGLLFVLAQDTISAFSIE